MAKRRRKVKFQQSNSRYNESTFNEEDYELSAEDYSTNEWNEHSLYLDS